MSQMNRPAARRSTLALLAAISMLTLGAEHAVRAAADRDNGAPPHFVPVPGVHELSGRMIVRPKQPAPPKDAACRTRIAKEIARYYPEVDEYIVNLPAGETEDHYAAMLMATSEYQY